MSVTIRRMACQGSRRGRAAREDAAAGFPTKAAAREALQERARVLMTDVSAHTLTVGEYLDTWLAGKHALKPTTLSQYRDFIDAFLKPHLGGIRLLELRAHHLDAFYINIRVVDVVGL